MDKIKGKFIYLHSDGNTHYKAFLKPGNTTTELPRHLENGTAEGSVAKETGASAEVPQTADAVLGLIL